MEKYFAYLDESGDLGFKFDRPYMKGGSARYLTISTIIVHEEDKQRLDRVIKKFREKAKFEHLEVHASDLEIWQRKVFCDVFTHEAGKATKFLKVYSITVSKQNVRHRLFTDFPNSLYNYSTGLGILDVIKDLDDVELFADARSTKLTGKYAFEEYLAAKLAGDMGHQGTFKIHMMDSKSSHGIQCADVIANTIWRSYEFGYGHNKEIFRSITRDKTLFF